MNDNSWRFRQVVLSQAQLNAGLVKHPSFPDPPPDAEPVPYMTIAVIDRDPSDLAERWQIIFQDTPDGLDVLALAVLDLHVGLRIGLKQYRVRPGTGTDLDIAPEDLIDLELVRKNLCRATDLVQDEALARISACLGLASDELVWVRPVPNPMSGSPE